VDKPVRVTAVVAAQVPAEVDFVRAVREGTEARLAELLGPVDCAVVAA